MNDIAARLDSVRDQPAELLAALFDRAPAAVCAVQDARVVYANDAAARLWQAPTPVAMLGGAVEDLFAGPAFGQFAGTEPVEPAVAEVPATMVIRRVDETTVEVGVTLVRTEAAVGGHVHLLLLAGPSETTAVPTETTAVPIETTACESAHTTGQDARVVPLYGTNDPGRPLVRAENFDRVTDSLDRLTEMVVAGLDEGIAIVDAQGRILWANPATTRITGLQEGDDFASLPLRSDEGTGVFPDLLAHRCGRFAGAADRLCSLDRGAGDVAWLSVAAAPLRDSPAGHAVVSVVDVSERQLIAEKLLYAAGHDELTGLPGRSLLIERIGTALDDRSPGRLGALMFIDLDRLKQVNDTHGHLAGDEVLRACAERLRTNLRRDDVIGRLGGDEFVVLVLGCSEAHDVVRIADRLHRRLNEPVVVDVDGDRVGDGTTVTVGASIGIVTIDDTDRRSPRRLLAEADSAMYRAKRAGRGRIAPSRPLLR